MKTTGLTIIDPILSLGVAIFILIEAAKNLREIVKIFLEITPSNINLSEIKTVLKSHNIPHSTIEIEEENENCSEKTCK